MTPPRYYWVKFKGCYLVAERVEGGWWFVVNGVSGFHEEGFDVGVVEGPLRVPEEMFKEGEAAKAAGAKRQ